MVGKKCRMAKEDVATRLRHRETRVNIKYPILELQTFGA
jgi:hypothetical protein